MAKKKQTIYSKDWASLHPYQGSAVQIFIIRQLQIKSIPYLMIYWETKYQMKIFFI